MKILVERNTAASEYTTDAIDYITEKEVLNASNITTGQTDSSYVTCTLDDSIIKFDATGETTSNKYGWINIPNNTLSYGEKYKVIFDFDASIGSGGDGYFGLATTTGSGGYTDKGVGLYSGNGQKSFSFIWTGEVCFKVASNSLHGVGKYIYISNFRVINDSKTYSTIPELEQKVNDLIGQNSIPSDATRSNIYSGSVIPSIKGVGRIGYKKLMNNASCQAGAAYGGYYFQFTNYHSSMNVYDLTTNTLHSTVSMTAVSEDHCNNACFSNNFYDNNDIFPLIYTSGSQSGTYNHAQVWRIQLESNVFSITKIQEITLPTGDGTEWMWGQLYLDNELGYMWYSSNGSHPTYYKFKIPSIFDSNSQVISEVTITQSNVLDSFTTEHNIHQQGGVVKNGILYLLDGVPAWGDNTKLYVIDLWGKRLVNIVNIQSLLGLTCEFEGCGIYNDTLIANSNGSGIYAIYF